MEQTSVLHLLKVMTPRQFIDYVIGHNQSTALYGLMSRVMPHWEEKRESLKQFEF